MYQIQSRHISDALFGLINPAEGLELCANIAILFLVPKRSFTVSVLGHIYALPRSALNQIQEQSGTPFVT